MSRLTRRIVETSIDVGLFQVGKVFKDLLRRHLARKHFKDMTDGEFEFSRHALKRVVERSIADQEIREAGAQASVIEDYPDDKYSHSCLLLGFTQTGRPLHIQVSLAETELVKIVTIYEPDPSDWGGLHDAEVRMFTCPVCNSQESRNDFVEEIFQIDGKYVLVDRIPATVCVRCGEETFSRETTEKVRLLVHGNAKPTKSLALQVFEFV